MDFKSVFSYIGVILEILGILALIPIIVAWIFNENVYTLFFITAIISFVLGTILDKKFTKKELTLGSAMVIAILSLVAVSIVGSIPYLFYVTPLNAFFESVSGFTTTGLSVLDATALPYSLLFWRSFTQWIGGIGILLIFLVLAGSPGISSYHLYRAEAKEKKIARLKAEKEAADQLQKEISLHLTQGRVHYYQKQYQQAIKQFTKALLLNPKDRSIEKYIIKSQKAIEKEARQALQAEKAPEAENASVRAAS